MIPCRGLNDRILVAFSAPLIPRMSLKPSQKRYLRGLAHALKPVIMVGNKGITDAVRAELALALEHHELIKVRLAGDDRAGRRAQVAELAEAGRAELVQTVGKVVCLFRRNDEAPKIALPR
jgi:RNA-binding protein